MAWTRRGSIDMIFTTDVLQSVSFVEMTSAVAVDQFFVRSGKNTVKISGKSW